MRITVYAQTLIQNLMGFLPNIEIATNYWEVLASTCPDIYGQVIGPVREVSVQK
jgi:hypothetical protein